MEAEQAPVQIGQVVLAKNLGIGAFGKVIFNCRYSIGLCSDALFSLFVA